MAETKSYAQGEVIATVHAILADEFEVEVDALQHPAAKLGEDLGLDSLDGVDLVVAIEKAFSCRIAEEEARKIVTLQDVYDRVLARLGQVGAVELREG